MLKTLLSISLLSITPYLYAVDSLPNQKNNYPYAAPCEAIPVNSIILKKFQQDLEKNPNQISHIQQQFWQNIQQQGTPIVEKIDHQHSRLIYLWRGAQHNVRISGGPSADHDWMTRLPNTDIWFKEYIVDQRYRGNYNISVDLPNVDGYLSTYCPQLNKNLKESRQQRQLIVDHQQIDPLNPQSFLAKNQYNLRNYSLISLDQAPTFIQHQDYPNHPQPIVKKSVLESKLFNNKRNIYIYQANKNKDQDYITAIFFDGEEYTHLLNTPKALDLMVSQGKIPPIQAIFVAHPDDQRSKELTPNAAFSQFFSQELLPWIDLQTENQRKKHKTVLLGSSLGGLSSASLALEYPQEVSHVVPLSGSFWWKKDKKSDFYMLDMIKNIQHQPQKWHLSANTFEVARSDRDMSIYETSPLVRDALQQKGHDVVLKNYVGGHAYAIWQVAVQDALLHFFASN